MADDAKLNQLKGKYQGALNAVSQLGISLQNVHIEGGKLLIRGKAPNEQSKNRFWDLIKQADPGFSDLTADISVDSSLPQPQAGSAGEGERSRQRTYTVQSGDTLSKISKEVYGDATQYNKIFDANRDKLSDPNKIYPGQELVIP
jgi:LysM repeat protein